MNAKHKAMLGSFLRILAACLIGAYLTLGKKPSDLRVDDLWSILDSAIGALAVTAVNYLRTGETRFGRGSEDMGMGGEDTITPPDGKVQTPDGPVDPPAELVDPQPVDTPVEEPPLADVEDPVEPVEEPVIQPLVRSVPIAEARKAAKKIPAKRTPKKPL